MDRTISLLGCLLLLGVGCQRHEESRPEQAVAQFRQVMRVGWSLPELRWRLFQPTLPAKAAKCEATVIENGEPNRRALPVTRFGPVARLTTTLVRHLDPGDPDALCLALAGTIHEAAGVDPPPRWLEIVRQSFQPARHGPPSDSFSVREPFIEQNRVTIYPPLTGLQPGEMPYGVSPEAELLWNQEQNLIVRLSGFRETTIPRDLPRVGLAHAIHLLLADEETFVAVVGDFGSPYTLTCCDPQGEIKWKTTVWGNGRNGMPHAGLVFHHVTMIASDDHLALFGWCTDGLYAECFERTTGAAELRWSSNNWYNQEISVD